MTIRQIMKKLRRLGIKQVEMYYANGPRYEKIQAVRCKCPRCGFTMAVNLRGAFTCCWWDCLVAGEGIHELYKYIRRDHVGLRIG